MKQSNYYDNIFINLALICFQLPPELNKIFILFNY